MPDTQPDNDARVDVESHLPRFGLSSFRPGQREVIDTVLGGGDCLCVMPTGGGKSLCYQLPALAMDGLTLVVSPLIALMKDQVDQLRKLDLPVTYINSTLPLAEQYDRLDQMAAGQYRLVYVVPERFRSSRFLDAVGTVGLSLLAVDEAHCISEWGHDFRPDYARLGHFRRKLGQPTTIALTATATDAVRRDIVEQLDLDQPRTFITGFARPNLFYRVQDSRGERHKGDLLVDFLRNTPGTGIVYASTRKRTEEVAGLIAERTGRRTAAYHAGLLPDPRHKTQESFMNGEVEIIVATTAFGMGIDKANVRFVVHYNLPGTLEAYYQEAGRAGRDGKQSKCLLLYNASDRYIQEYFIESVYPAPENVAAVYDYLRTIDADPIELTQQDIKDALNLPIGADGVGTCEQLLESAGVLERLIASQNMAAVRLDSDLPTLVDLLPKQAKTRRRVLQAIERLVGPRRNELIYFRPDGLARSADITQSSLAGALRELNRLEAVTYVRPFRGRAIRMIDGKSPFDQLAIDFEALDRRKAAEYEKLNRVVRFAIGSGCRQQTILHYFGEKDAGQCGHCDNCEQSNVPMAGGDTVSATSHEEILKTIRIVLSGVARTQARFACGKNLIAQMLCGSASAKMEKLGLNQLSTFGLLGHLTQPDVAKLIDCLVAAECLEQVAVELGRPVVQMTELGTDLMKGTGEPDIELPLPADLSAKLRGEQPVPNGPTEADQADLPPAAPDLVAALKKWRLTTAAETSLPPHYVLTNRTLEEIARRRPDSPEALFVVKGIGEAKLRRYGPEILRIVAGDGSVAVGGSVAGQPTEPSDPAEGDLEDTPADSAETSEHPSHYWTQRLLEAGFSVDECAQIRGISRNVIQDHARLIGRKSEVGNRKSEG